MKIVLFCILGVLGLGLTLVLIALLRTLLSPAKQSLWKPAAEPEREKRYAETLSRMVRCETVSRKGEDQRKKFLGFHRLLEELFPLVHGKLEKTEIDDKIKEGAGKLKEKVGEALEKTEIDDKIKAGVENIKDKFKKD